MQSAQLEEKQKHCSNNTVQVSVLNRKKKCNCTGYFIVLHAFPNLLVLAVASLAFETIQLPEVSFIIWAGPGSPFGRQVPGRWDLMMY